MSKGRKKSARTNKKPILSLEEFASIMFAEDAGGHVFNQVMTLMQKQVNTSLGVPSSLLSSPAPSLGAMASRTKSGGVAVSVNHSWWAEPVAEPTVYGFELTLGFRLPGDALPRVSVTDFIILDHVAFEADKTPRHEKIHRLALAYVEALLSWEKAGTRGVSEPWVKTLNGGPKLLERVLAYQGNVRSAFAAWYTTGHFTAPAFLAWYAGAARRIDQSTPWRRGFRSLLACYENVDIRAAACAEPQGYCVRYKSLLKASTSFKAYKPEPLLNVPHVVFTLTLPRGS